MNKPTTPPHSEEHIPKTFGRWTTLGPKFPKAIGSSGLSQRQSHQLCQCSCGTIREVPCHRLKNNLTRSCGCLSRELTRSRSLSHGKSLLSEYRCWRGLLRRCLNEEDKQYHLYGGRGIAVCERWQDPDQGLINFMADMGMKPSAKHSIDRIDNNGNYEPCNCRWATVVTQARNKRCNVYVTYDGRTQTRQAWSLETGIPFSTLRARLLFGWEVALALTTPVRKCVRSRKLTAEQNRPEDWPELLTQDWEDLN